MNAEVGNHNHHDTDLEAEVIQEDTENIRTFNLYYF